MAAALIAVSSYPIGAGMQNLLARNMSAAGLRQYAGTAVLPKAMQHLRLSEPSLQSRLNGHSAAVSIFVRLCALAWSVRLKNRCSSGLNVN